MKITLGILTLALTLMTAVGCSENDQSKSANSGIAVPNSAPQYIVVRVAKNNRNVDYAVTQSSPQNSEFNQLPWQAVNNQTVINQNSGFPTNTYDANIFFVQNSQNDQDQSYDVNDGQFDKNNYGYNGAGHHGQRHGQYQRQHHGQRHGNFHGYYNYPNYYGYSSYHYAHYYPANYYSYYYNYNYLPAYYYNYGYWYYTPVTTYYTNPYYRYYLYQLWW